jgi:hypothetical protein
MAINRFENVTHSVTDTSTTIYTAPTGFSAIVILAQATNVTANTSNITFAVEESGGNTTFLAYEQSIPSNDAAGLLTGKLVLKPGQSVSAVGSQNNAIQLVLSILESEN